VESTIPAPTINFPYEEEKPVCYNSTSEEATTVEMSGDEIFTSSPSEARTSSIIKTTSITEKATSPSSENDHPHITTVIDDEEKTTTDGCAGTTSTFYLYLFTFSVALFLK